MAMLFTKGDMFKFDFQVLVNPVNCVGVMGAGLAKEFRDRYPSYYQWYREECRTGRMRMGEMSVYPATQLPRLISFPTKYHWRDSSYFENIVDGLHSLKETISTLGLEHPTVGIPAVGCGLGGLDWGRVKPEIQRILSPMPNISILVFEPL